MTNWKLCIAVGALLYGASPGQSTYEKANALFVAKKFSESLAAVEEALRLDGNLIPALTLKAKLAMAANRYDLARQSLERALAVDPKAPYPQFLYGMEAYMNNEMKEALPRFRKARELAPQDPRAALYLGLTTESVGQPQDALALYREAIRLERATGQQQAETLLPGARLLMLLGRLDECEGWIRQAVKLSPNLRDAHFELARLLLKKGEAAKAAAEGELSLGLSEGTVTDTAIHYLLIRAWQQAGSPERAAVHAGVIRAQETPVVHTVGK
ncbi:MAG: tetratricopeptide repeat protein [Bryobacteraceae bacterium]